MKTGVSFLVQQESQERQEAFSDELDSLRVLVMFFVSLAFRHR